MNRLFYTSMNKQIINKRAFYNWGLSILLFSSLLLPNLLQAQASFDTTLKVRPKIGLVLSGGGAKGYAHIGALKVFRDAGIEFDYISGTSMGSIVGGLYAIGYTPESIEKMVSEQNWSDLLLDKIDRKSLSFNEKYYNEQQFISFPITKESISLPFGIKYGQNISQLLSNLVSPVHQFHSFSEFQTPFLCIGTDIANGQSVILDKGDLASAMRASMAIPTVITPVQIDGRLLVDGGLVNNFPAKELAERGCDIIIGVDVQTHKDYTVSDLGSITSILDRSAGFYREALFDTALRYIDYYINPDIADYSVGSFNDFDSIILRGERAAQLRYSELLKLSAYLKSFPDYQMKTRDLKPLNRFIIDSVMVVGNHEVPTKVILSSVKFEKGSVVEMSDLNKAIQQLYGTLFYNAVKFSFLPGKQGTVLRVEVEESGFGTIGLGIHYDTDYKAGLLLTGRFRNVLLKNTLLETTLGLSENPHFGINYYQNKGLLPSLGLDAKWSSFGFIEYLNGKDKINQYRFTNLSTRLYLQSVYKRTTAFGGGIQFEISSLRNDVGIDFAVNNSKFSQTNFNFFGFLKVDNFDHSYFPHNGNEINVSGVFITQFLTGGNLNLGEKSTIFAGSWEKAIPLTSRFTLRPRANLGFTIGNGIYLGHLFALGGQGSNYLPGIISFTGLNVMQRIGSQIIAGRVLLQYQLFKKHYVSALIDFGQVTYDISELFNWQSGSVGYGLVYGYDSFIGPVEFLIMGSNYRGLSAYFSVGFWF